jgi:DNA-binding NarL/FixJ family response regulator
MPPPDLSPTQLQTPLPKAPAEILIVEDHPLLRAGLRLGLQGDPSFCVVSETASAREALSAFRLHPVPLVIVDITLPGGMDGIELTKCLLSERPDVLILVLSVHEESLYALRAIGAGARGYLMKDRSLPEVREALLTLLRGEYALSQDITQRLVARAARMRGTPPKPTIQGLSDRELEVLLLIGKGLRTLDIARSLGLSPKTVESHRANLRRKLALKTGPELIRYALACPYALDSTAPATHPVGNRASKRICPSKPRLQRPLQAP